MSILTDKYVTTRKEHRCHGCARVFPNGTKMKYVTESSDGSVVSAYWCEECESIIMCLEYWQIEDGFGVGELKDTYPEKYRPYV